MNNSRTIAIAAAILVGCGGGGKKPPPATDGSAGKVLLVKPSGPGLEMRLSEGKSGKPAIDRAKLAPAKKLAEAEVAKLLSRSKPLVADAADQQAFALRPSSQPAPRTGEVVKTTFPAAPSTLLPPKANDAGKDLTVLRFMPEGKVPLAPELSVTFSQPMIAVTSQDDAAKVQPVKLTPTPKGKWRWIGTRTILFDPEVRFPQSTTYQVEIPAGTKSASGTVLKAATKFSFETPAPTVMASYPQSGQPQHLDVPMLVLFDQKIDRTAMLQKIVVKANDKAMGVRLLDAQELAKDDELKAYAVPDPDKDGRWLAFRTQTKFPAAARITVEVATGAPSAEGPNKTLAPQAFSFQTYPPLEIEEARCGYNEVCRPRWPFQIRFNNPLDADKFDGATIKVSPAIEHVKIVQRGTTISVGGETKARVTYKVTIPAGTLDEFGQKLGKDQIKTFTVGDAEPTFYGPSGMVVLDPTAKKQTLDFFTTNYEQLVVKIYKVQPADFGAYVNYIQNQWNKDKPPPVPGQKVFDQAIRTSTDKNALVENHIDLAPALSAGLGHAVVIVEPRPWPHKYNPDRHIAWVQSTKLAVDAHVDGDNLIAFATELETGKPAAGVDLEIQPYALTGKSDNQGVATIALSPTSKTGYNFVTARRGADVAFVDDGRGYPNGNWFKQTPGKRLAWYVADDRNLYKPGEEVSLKGWLRLVDHAKNGDVGGTTGVTSVSYLVKDSRGNKIAEGTAPVSGLGGFDTKFTLPTTPNLGSTYVEFTAGTDRTTHYIRVEEFRRPEFEVTAQASEGPFLVGGGGDFTVDAKYYAGGPLAGAAATWNVTATQTNFTPPDRDDYTFGTWTPWWGGYGGYYDHDEEDYDYGRRSRRYKPNTFSAKTDAGGAHILHIDFLGVEPAMPMTVTTSVSVSDVNRQTWSASTSAIVHPGQYYVGLKAAKSFVEKGTPFDVEVIGVDIAGKIAPGAKIDVKTVRLDWEYRKGKYTTKEVDPQSCPITAAATPGTCKLKTTTGGTYQITATITDAQGRPNQSKLTFWVTGGDNPPAREVEQELVQIIPDKKEYAPGQTAELLLQAPFYPAEAIVTWRRSGIVKTERMTFDGPTKVLKVPITDQMTPNLYVHVDLVGSAPRTDDKGKPNPKLPRRPAYAVGVLNLPIPPKQRTLAVTVKPAAAKLSPGESTTMAVEVKDANGRPVANAEAAVIVVDEAILSLAAYTHPDPIGPFYPARQPGAQSHYLRRHVKLAKPEVSADDPAPPEEENKQMDGDDESGGAGTAMALEEGKMGKKEFDRAEGQYKMKNEKADSPARQQAIDQTRNAGILGSTKGKPPGQPEPIVVRSNFNPLAAFSPTVRTDANGRASVPVKLPDNLTRYRVVAIVAAGEKQFGKGESAITARLPLMVRPSPPRFLNFGDTFELPVVVQNQTDSPIAVKVAVRATNIAITDGAGREVTVPANERVEVRFPAAAQMAGTARFQIVGTAGQASDAAELSLPVWTPATTEAFATYGVIDEGATRQPIALPGKVVTQFGGLEVTTASTNLQALTDAMLYLVHYKFECSEQRSSRILAIAALRDVLEAFKVPEMPSRAALEASMAKDIERLSQMQNGDGGFAFWERGYDSVPYLTVYVASALQAAHAKGYTAGAAMIERAKPYLRSIESHYPAGYPKEVRWAISAYALHVRKLMGDVDIAKAKRLFAEAGVDKLSMEANGWLLSTMAGNAAATTERKAIVRHVMNKVSETAGAASFTTSYGDGAYLILASDHRVDAVLLDALIQEQKDLDLIPKVVTGLLAHRKAGRWLNTQENTYALLALDRYFQTYEKVTPDFVARIWLGNDYAGDLAFKGRSTKYFQVNIPMKDVAAHDKQDLTIQKDGKGRLYYRVGMKYAPASLQLAAADHGFVVERRYEGVDDPKDVTRDQQGVWHIKAGARVRIKISMVNEARRYHVALVDPLPAGLEPLNPALATTGPIPQEDDDDESTSGGGSNNRGRYWWWYGPWYEHQNMRDERVEAFASLLWEGVHKYTYVARATTPGTFVVPPPKAEEMYMPETFGRGASDRVIVE
ncbi:MAG TPA: Ig-like domain-containing protein [Kofleriaceae bacterium]